MTKGQIVGLVGVVLLFIGVLFLPVMNLPIIGGIPYIKGDGIFVLILSIVALILNFQKENKRVFIWIPALLIFFILVWFGINFSERYVEMTTEVNDKLRGNMFKSLANAMMMGVSLGAGWYAMMLGGVVTFISGFIKEEKNEE